MEKIKNRLKKIKLIYLLNAKIKAWQTKNNYKKVCKYYENQAKKRGVIYNEKTIPEKIKQRLSQRGLKIKPIPKGKLCILYIGNDEFQDKGGFLQSLQKFGKVHVFTQKNGSYGQNQNNSIENGKRLLELVKKTQKQENLHIVIGQMWGFTMPWQVLDKIRKMGIITINICMDDNHKFGKKTGKGNQLGSSALIPGLDLALTTTPKACLWYEVEGLPSLYWPEASDPKIYHPIKDKKQYEVCFVGKNYGIREKIIKTIKKRGIDIRCYGDGWSNKRISPEQITKLFAKSKIILGVGTREYCTDFYALKLRDFDAPMSGSLYITHNNPELHELFKIGKEIVIYTTPEECADKIKYYLNHPEERETIAKAGRKRAIKDHTWEKRFEKLFKYIRILK